MKKGKVCMLTSLCTYKVASWIAMGITDFLLGNLFPKKKFECQPFPMIFIKTHLMITYSNGGIPLMEDVLSIMLNFAVYFPSCLYLIASFLEKIIAIKLESTEKIFGIKMYWTDRRIFEIFEISFVIWVLCCVVLPFLIGHSIQILFILQKGLLPTCV